jgi:ABC-type polysaccharide/polyol phosphate export permease
MSPLLRHFVLLELRKRFLGTVGAGLWAIAHPLLQLAIYSTVFAVIFQARVPELPDAPFAVWLALAFWPWIAFAEAVQRGAAVVGENAALIGKVALPTELLPTATTVASFLVHGLGYLAVLLVLALLGQPLRLWLLPLALPLFVGLLVLAHGVALLVAALSVFLRDVAQLTTQLLMLGFFLTPIFYSRSMLPEAWRPWLDLNPMTAYVEGFRALFLDLAPPSTLAIGMSVAGTLFAAIAGRILFRRLARHFHDYL